MARAWSVAGNRFSCKRGPLKGRRQLEQRGACVRPGTARVAISTLGSTRCCRVPLDAMRNSALGGRSPPAGGEVSCGMGSERGTGVEAGCFVACRCEHATDEAGKVSMYHRCEDGSRCWEGRGGVPPHIKCGTICRSTSRLVY